MATWADVRAIAMSLPETTEGASRESLLSWAVRGKGFVWERPLRKGDLAALGEAAPTGPILGVRVPDLGAKEALLATADGACFTTPHFDGYPAVLVLLEAVDVAVLRELVVEAWFTRAPKRVAAAYRAADQAGHQGC